MAASSHHIQTLLAAFLSACQFLTSLPLALRAAPSADALRASLLFYPLVGLLMGGVLVLVAWAGSALPPDLTAAVVLAIWVLASGALHLDGLADSADAWLGGLGNRERTLAIMKDPRSGPMAVTVLVLSLLLKYAALQALLGHIALWLLALIPMLARMGVLLLLLTTDYVREGGLGAALVDGMPRARCWQVLALFSAVLVFAMGLPGLWLLLCCGLAFIGLRQMMLSRLQGCTGDTLGALIEILEVVALLAWAVYLYPLAAGV